MNTSHHPNDYPSEPSRLSFYPGTCRTPINTRLWDQHINTLRTLERQAAALGLWQISFEFALLIAEHVSAQLKVELGEKP